MRSKMFKKILIANRGEIAVRIIRTCRRMGIRTTVVYSEADARSLHVQAADEAVLIGKAPATQSYLSKEKLIDAALKKGCEAIHPGYGFLSENADFCEQVTRAGLLFIGPPAKAISALGDKMASKALAIKAGVPTVPGHGESLKDAKEAIAIAEKIGYPVLLKPAAGGGGKGMRIVHAKEEMASALDSCRKETVKAFGDDKIFMERYIVRPRHIEIQVMADYHGQIVYLVERECSIQRRYQKIIEETPSLAVDDATRRKMGECACNLAREAGYTNAGTVEYILDPDGNFYFLEMNTRLQVEHPVTEMVTGLDLVELQLKVAAGEPLGLTQNEVTFSGWSIEARICAEDPSRHFMPSSGMVTRYAEPWGGNIRVDSGIQAGSVVGAYYDSMLAKVIAKGKDREEARVALVDALNGYHIEGLHTNVYYTNAILNHPAFVRGELSTAFIPEHMEDPEKIVAPPVENIHHMVLASTLIYHNRQNLVRHSLKPMAAHVGSTPKPKDEYFYMVKGGEAVFEVRLWGEQVTRSWKFFVDDNEYHVITPEFEYYRRRLKLEINGKTCRFRVDFSGNYLWGAYCGITRTFEVYTPREWALAQYMPKPRRKVTDNILISPMPGMVVDILARKGERVYRGQTLVVVESMKMESGVSSPCDGDVVEILAKPGQAVETGDVLIKFSV